MNISKFQTLLFAVPVLFAAGCTSGPAKSPDVAGVIRKDLDQAHLDDVTVSQDRDKGVVTLGGNVKSDADKGQAETIAKKDASGQVVANQVAVLPPGADDAKKVNSDIDKGIEENLGAALLQAKLNDGVRPDVKNGVVTLKGNVNSQVKRARVEKLASGVPNVQQVVNELEVKDQKASSTQ